MMDREDSKLQLVSEEAAEWFVRIKDRDIDAADRRRYVKWLKESPVHVAEFLRTSHRYRQLRRADLPTLELRDEQESNVLQFLAKGSARDSSRPKRQLWSPLRWRLAATISSTAFVCLMVVLVKAAWFDRTITTTEREWRQITLADGSVVRMGPDTEIRIRFGDERRFISLSHGEAVFQVAKDRLRPFDVSAGLAVIRAVGTEFGVVRGKDKIIVTVAEGKVAVTQGDPHDKAMSGTARHATVPVSADEQVLVTPRSWPVLAKKVNATRELAWSRGRLVFENKTLAEAAEEFNRRNYTKIIIDDPDIAAYKVCCVFDASDPESFAEAIAIDSDIALSRDEPGVLILESEHNRDVRELKATSEEERL